MRKGILIALLAVSFTNSSSAQVLETEAGLKKVKTDLPEGWQKGGLFSVAVSQVSVTNWAAGGKNSLSANGLFSFFADYGKGKLAWNNSLDLGYGLMKQGEAKIIKTDDNLDVMSKVGMKAAEKWFYTGLVNFKSQMTPGYNYPNDSVIISKFLAPAYLLGAIGMDYKGAENFSLFLAPLTGRITFVNDDALSAAGAFGVDKGKKSRLEFGGYIRSTFKKNLAENITFQTKIDLFSNYVHKPQNIDVNWETLILMKATKFITLSLSTHLIYDDDIMIVDKDGKKGPRTQIKEVLGVGLSYKF